jgi:SpoVK/Ycf46/Vps4 family AAA+-type ATPase
MWVPPPRELPAATGAAAGKAQAPAHHLFLLDCLHTCMRSEDEVQQLAAATQGCTGSDLSVLCRDAAMAPLRELMASGALQQRGLADASVRPVTYADFTAAVRKMGPASGKAGA